MKILGVACSHCGAPTRVSLANPDAMRCSKCGYFGPPPPDAPRALHAARQVLASLDKRRLRITGLQRGIVIGSVGGVGMIGILFVVVVVVMGLVAAAGISLAVWQESLRLGDMAVGALTGAGARGAG
jgi:hypothetical protein